MADRPLQLRLKAISLIGVGLFASFTGPVGMPVTLVNVPSAHDIVITRPIYLSPTSSAIYFPSASCSLASQPTAGESIILSISMP